MDADPVVQEMRRHGEQIAEECDGDMHRMGERFRREQAEGTHPIRRRQARSGERRRIDTAPT